MSTNKFYKQAIDLLNSGKELDYKKVVVELAKEHPRWFVELVVPAREVFEVLKKEPWHTEARNYLTGNQKVEGIKLIRNKTGHGLKEAKDVADRACELMDPFAVKTYSTIGSLSSEQEELARSIAA